VDRRTRAFYLIGLIVTIGIAIGVSQLASDDPDGLEYVAEQEGFADSAEEHDLAANPLADYGDGLTGSSVLDTVLAGVVGVLVTLGLGWVLFRAIRRPDDRATLE
jgi:hypothetical protein